ncbi:YbhB/YbcL family Raf kinase inhibitor-like protein [Mycoplasma procyoni]|uniref:YbhB/YbcL family Raf kinase inhibitor-like protein n=1 Tax=Mycoplasma procyoni TaxID=568784 RepID=UPI00197B628F|nr:YbhB/YbcL family Raf kinase inhibitor-like protein [Mycoplasma procyoni]MBN3535037.1 YbhB/YbcL family Raf kinase inhibitor-like protein [Mycoplasma procyoni]
MKIYIKDVKNGVLNTMYGNGNSKDNSVSFPIKWDKVKGAKSYAITLIDKEATRTMGAPFIHWIAANIKTNKIDWDFSFQNKDKILQIENSMTSQVPLHLVQRIQKNAVPGVFLGPFPIEADHNYELRVFALNTEKIEADDFNKEEHVAFFDDFQTWLMPKIIDQGFSSFLYRTKFKIENGQIVENNKTEEELNEPLEEQEQSFYKHNTEIQKINIKSSGIYKKGDFNYLKNFYVGKIHGDYFHSVSMPLKWNKIEGAKSYLITLLGNAEVKVFGTPTVYWIKNISADQFSSDEILLESQVINEHTKKDILDQKYHYINTFGSHVAPLIAAGLKSDPQIFRWISNDYGLIDLPGMSFKRSGVYTLSIYALDIEQIHEQNDQFQVITLTEALQKAKSHVIAEGNLVFKVENE